MAYSEKANRIAKFQFTPKSYDVYTPEGARYAAEAEGVDIRKAYQSMRKVAEERLRKLGASDYKTTEIYKDNVNRFPRLTEIGKDNQLLYDAIAEVSHFLSLKKSTIYGYREYERKSLESITETYGSEGIKGLSWRAFGSMMESIKGSAQAMARYNRWKQAYRAALSRARKLEISREQLEKLVADEVIKIGASGGILNAKTGRSIRKGWAGLGK